LPLRAALLGADDDDERARRLLLHQAELRDAQWAERAAQLDLARARGDAWGVLMNLVTPR
jgi:hypothetical protein